jgi:transcriptional repressor NrdR
MVVKRDGRHEPYDRNKLLTGILLACRKRPVSRNDIDRLIDEVEAGFAEEYRLEVPSVELGERVLTGLSRLDPVAYVRFASVYRQFDSPEQFADELHNLEKGGSGAPG